jgi:hypothetical protein
MDGEELVLVCGSPRSISLSGAGTTNVKGAPGNGNSNARVLHQVLLSNSTVELLVCAPVPARDPRRSPHSHLPRQDISNTGIDDDGIHEVCEGLKKNSSVTHLNISRNSFTSQASPHTEETASRPELD